MLLPDDLLLATARTDHADSSRRLSILCDHTKIAVTWLDDGKRLNGVAWRDVGLGKGKGKLFNQRVLCLTATLVREVLLMVTFDQVSLFWLLYVYLGLGGAVFWQE